LKKEDCGQNAEEESVSREKDLFRGKTKGRLPIAGKGPTSKEGGGGLRERKAELSRSLGEANQEKVTMERKG